MGAFRFLKHAINRRGVRSLLPVMRQAKAAYVASGRSSRTALRAATAQVRRHSINMARGARAGASIGLKLGAIGGGSMLGGAVLGAISHADYKRQRTNARARTRRAKRKK